MVDYPEPSESTMSITPPVQKIKEFKLGNDLVRLTVTPQREDFEITRDWLALCLTQLEKTIIPAAETGLFDQKPDDKTTIANQIMALSNEAEEQIFDTIIAEMRENLATHMPKPLIDAIVTGIVEDVLPFAKQCQYDTLLTNYSEAELASILKFFQDNPWYILKSRTNLHKTQRQVLEKMQEVLEHKVDTDTSLDEALDRELEKETKGDKKLFTQLKHVLDMDVNDLVGQAKVAPEFPKLVKDEEDEQDS